jgi:hypothetical protein
VYPSVHLVDIAYLAGENEENQGRRVQERVTMYGICPLRTHDPYFFPEAVKCLGVKINGHNYELTGEITEYEHCHVWKGTIDIEVLDTTPQPNLFRQHLSIEVIQFSEEEPFDSSSVEEPFYSSSEEGPFYSSSEEEPFDSYPEEVPFDSYPEEVPFDSYPEEGPFNSYPEDPLFHQMRHLPLPSSTIPMWEVQCAGITSYSGYGIDLLFKKKQVEVKSLSTYIWFLLWNVFFALLFTVGLKFIGKVFLDKWLWCFLFAICLVAVDWKVIREKKRTRSPVLGRSSDTSLDVILETIERHYA